MIASTVNLGLTWGKAAPPYPARLEVKLNLIREFLCVEVHLMNDARMDDGVSMGRDGVGGLRTQFGGMVVMVVDGCSWLPFS